MQRRHRALAEAHGHQPARVVQAARARARRGEHHVPQMTARSRRHVRHGPELRTRGRGRRAGPPARCAQTVDGGGDGRRDQGRSRPARGRPANSSGRGAAAGRAGPHVHHPRDGRARARHRSRPCARASRPQRPLASSRDTPGGPAGLAASERAPARTRWIGSSPIAIKSWRWKASPAPARPPRSRPSARARSGRATASKGSRPRHAPRRNWQTPASPRAPCSDISHESERP